MEHIRAYNQMFAMMSFGAKVNDSVNKERVPYVFKISGQIYHWIGSLCPKEGNHPLFLQLYIYDTCNEVSNRMRHFSGVGESAINLEIVQGEIPTFKIRLYNITDTRGYELPTADLLGGIVFEDGPRTRVLPRIAVEASGWQRQRKKSHDERVLQIPVASACEGVWAYLQGWQAFNSTWSRGDRKGIVVSSKIILLRTFTGRPRYMYSHYLDALAICRSLGNPQFFITFTCNVKCPEIKRHMAQYLELTPADRADVVCRVFEQKLKEFLPFLKEVKTFGNVSTGPVELPAQVQRGESKLDNCDVVPSNRTLCLAFEGWSMLIKYLFKYISKGRDRILAKISNSDESTTTTCNRPHIDEIQNYVDARFICPYDACWRIFDFLIHSQEPAV
ncbi:DNA helicase [Tanacetum coccineum]|uniref:DNA helicase n=1 Tax=Tanacetum coccineum TaxID=301880 RepID=A0ABQ5FZ64_9ASTR